MSSPAGFDALIHGPAVVRRSDRGIVRLEGDDRASWLQGLVTNDVAALEPGRRIYSAYLTPQGRMITDLWAVAAPGAMLLDVPAPLASALTARLDGLIFAEDVQVENVSHEWAVAQIFGATDDTDRGLTIEDFTYGIPSRVAYVPAARLDVVLGTFGPYTEVGLDALEVLRVEAGVPRFLVDMTEDTIPLEAGIEDRAVSFTKGCYVGQEIIVRVTTRGGGRVARRLVGLAFDGAEVPAAGSPIHAAGKTVGRVTSAVHSPRCASVIGLGYVHRDVTEPGTRLEVETGARRTPATVRALPFVPPAV